MTSAVVTAHFYLKKSRALGFFSRLKQRETQAKVKNYTLEIEKKKLLCTVHRA